MGSAGGLPTGQDEVQELEGRLEASAGEADLVGIHGQEGQGAEEGQEAGSHGKAAGRVVAVEDTVQLRVVGLVLVAIGQQGGKHDQGEDLWVGSGVPEPEWSSCLPKPAPQPSSPSVSWGVCFPLSWEFQALPPGHVLRAFILARASSCLLGPCTSLVWPP